MPKLDHPGAQFPARYLRHKTQRHFTTLNYGVLNLLEKLPSGFLAACYEIVHTVVCRLRQTAWDEFSQNRTVNAFFNSD